MVMRHLMAGDSAETHGMQAQHQDQAGSSRAGPSLHTLAASAAAQTSSALAQISSSTAGQAAPSSQAGASRAGPSLPVTAHAQSSSTPTRSSGTLIQNSSTPGQTAELPSSTQPTDAHFVLWRPPMMWHDHQQGKASAAAPIYLRDEVCFFITTQLD